MNYSKNFDFGPMTFKSYFKPVGQGYEVTVYFDGHPYFVGNFVHRKEATTWWKMLKSEMKTFCTKYDYVKGSSSAWYCHFLSNQLYKTYYKYLDTVFTKYNKTYSKAWTKDVTHYKTLHKKSFATYKTTSYRKAA